MAEKVGDNAEALLDNLISNFSLDNAKKWLRKKFSSYTPNDLRFEVNSQNRNNSRYFGEIRNLGYLTLDNTPVIVYGILMKNDLERRSSRVEQFRIAKDILKIECNNTSYGGLVTQGLFFFYDNDGFFRISLVTGRVDKKKFVWSEAKRQSFYVDPNKRNNIVRRRLHEAINTLDKLKNAFSVEELTEEFYNRLFSWYEKAIDEKTGVTFPNDVNDKTDDRKQLPENIIRLITRLMFVWFVRQKGLVPDALFKEDDVSSMLKDFKPTDMEQDIYYKAILQNLFFATFNGGEDNKQRKFRNKSSKGYSTDYFVKNKYRYEVSFKDKDRFLDLMNTIPFMNCALFDCLDRKYDEIDGGKEILLDGFSDVAKRQAHIPNGLFFGKEGIISLFDTYEFTIDENSVDDADLALDPELLGKVFENLLGAYNPETKQTAKKSTGSYYTPREIVDFMVKESLQQYLNRCCADITEEELQSLFDNSIESRILQKEKREILLDALYKLRILDPACGSGAFPMGILSRMVSLFEKLDPENVYQRKMILDRYSKEKKLCDAALSNEKVQERLKELEERLKEENSDPDYARKLYIIENCIYGVDIQPIATQISKLRFFITLLCDQLRTGDLRDIFLSLPNLEAKFVCADTLVALPNEEGMELSFYTPEVLKLRNELKKNRHVIFNVKSYETKKKRQEIDVDLRRQIKEAIRRDLSTPNEAEIKRQQRIIEEAEKKLEKVKEVKLKRVATQTDLFGGEEIIEIDENEEKRIRLNNEISSARTAIRLENAKANRTNTSKLDKIADMVSSWDPYDQNACSPFFDAEWMFNIQDGFDIVIGNPPYIQLTTSVGEEKLADKYIKEGYESFERTGDIYCLFYERGVELLCNKGNLNYITSNSWMRSKYGASLRNFLVENTNPQSLIDFGGVKVFKKATVNVNILLTTKEEYLQDTLACSLPKDMSFEGFASYVKDNSVNYKFLKDEIWTVISLLEQSIKNKIEAIGTPLKDWNINIYRGVLTGFDNAFVINTAKREEILLNCETEDERERTEKLIRPVLKGKDIKRYSYNWSGLWLINTHNGIKGKIPRIDIEDYPAVKAYLDTHWQQIEKRADQGATPYNLRNCAYIEDFDKPKIVYQELSQGASFTFDYNGEFVVLNSAYIIIGENIDWLFSLLNSRLIVFAFKNFYAKSLGTSALRWLNQYVLTLPIAKYNNKEKNNLIKEYATKLRNIKNNSNEFNVLNKELDNLIYEMYGLTEEEIAVIEGCGEIEEEKKEPKKARNKKKCSEKGEAAKTSSREDEWVD